MSYLTFQQYLDLTGLTLTGVNANFVNAKLKTWSAQINILTGQYFADNNQSKIVNFDQCTQFLLAFSAFRQFPTVEIKERGDATWQTLTADVDFIWRYPKFTTYLNGAPVANPVVGLDFRCLSCRCSCEMVKISGNQSWSNGLPDDLKDILVQLVSDLLATDPNAYTSGFLPIKYMYDNIASERDQTRSVTYRDKKVEYEQRQQNLRQGVNGSQFFAITQKYLKSSINVPRRFYA